MTVEKLDMDYENDYAIYYLPDTKIVVFKYHVPTLESFNMSQEEKALGLRLCIEARLNGNWFGDILNH